MREKEYLALNNPLIYIFIIFITCAYTFEVYQYNRLLAALTASSLFILLMLKKRPVVIAILAVFILVAYLDNHFYYSYIPAAKEEVRITKLNSGYGIGEIKGRLVSITIDDGAINVGDKIKAEGSFIADPTFTKGIIGIYRINKYKVMQKDLISYLSSIRRGIYQSINEKLGERKAALLSSMAFGYTDNIDQDDRDDLGNLGISHIIAVSGLHLAIVYMLLKKIFKVPAALALTLIYVLFTGASASTIRAYVMVLLMELGFILRRNYNPLAALSFAGIVSLIIKPYYIFNLGFALSFSAALGIILFNKRINKKLYKLPAVIRDTAAVSLSAQIFTLPISIIYFSEYSFNFLLGNMLAIPLMNILIILGIILIFTWKVPLIFNYILYLCHYLIRIEDYIIMVLGRISMDKLIIHWSAAAFFIAFLITYYFYQKGYKKFIYFPIIVLIYVIITDYSLVPSIKNYRDGGLLISYKGQKQLIIYNEEAEVDKLSRKSLCNKVLYKNHFKKIVISRDIILSRKGENYLMETNKGEYILKVNYGKANGGYDIIDFIKGDITEIKVFDDDGIMYK